uniref:Uncharacterized protein n=1 Tax=Knipowitschia caucasica TaxID=637954 RepID=A0AAV2LSA8_KNICA
MREHASCEAERLTERLMEKLAERLAEKLAEKLADRLAERLAERLVERLVERRARGQGACGSYRGPGGTKAMTQMNARYYPYRRITIISSYLN